MEYLPMPQVTLDGKLLLAGDAGEGVSLLLLQAVVHELDSVGKQSPAVGAAHQLLLAVAPEVFLQLGGCGVSPGAAKPPARGDSLISEL